MQMVAKRYDSGCESGVGRGYKSQGRFLLTERHKTGMAEKACNGSALALGTCCRSGAGRKFDQGGLKTLRRTSRPSCYAVEGLATGPDLCRLCAGRRCAGRHPLLHCSAWREGASPPLDAAAKRIWDKQSREPCNYASVAPA